MIFSCFGLVVAFFLFGSTKCQNGFTVAPLQGRTYVTTVIPLQRRLDTTTVPPLQRRLVGVQCAKTSVIVGEVFWTNEKTLKVRISTSIKLQLNLGETVCVDVRFSDTDNCTNCTAKDGGNLNNTILYAIQYQGLKQIYPIRQQYTFAIPQFESKCICDCPGGENHCVIGYNYRNCSKNAFCVTTYHPHQKATGCFAGEEAELCCDVTATPYKNMKFEAVHLTQPSTAGNFQYKIYALSGDEWTLKKKEQFQVPLNRDHRLDFNDDKLEMQISGTKSYWQLDSGMYFYENQTSNSKLRTGVPINELYEWNTGKLGWFRLQDEHFTVANGWLEIQDAHHVQVEHCKDQRYTDNYKAHFFSNQGKNATKTEEQAIAGVYLGHTVEESEPWIESILLPNGAIGTDRQIVVETKEAPTISIDLTLNSKVELKFLFHNSELKDFFGVIQLDKHSNKFINLTLIDAKGTLFGALYRDSDKKLADLAFSANVESVKRAISTNSTFLLVLPSNTDSTRYVCLHPSERVGDEVCKWIEYDSVPLEHIDIKVGWTENLGDCPGCNEMTWSSFFNYLNPKQWFDGISSASEAFAMTLEIGFYILVFIAITCVCRRCLCPVMKMLVCFETKPSKPSV